MTNTQAKSGITPTVLNDNDLAPVSGGLELPIAPVGAIEPAGLPGAMQEAERQLLDPIANPMRPDPTNT